MPITQKEMRLFENIAAVTFDIAADKDYKSYRDGFESYPETLQALALAGKVLTEEETKYFSRDRNGERANNYEWYDVLETYVGEIATGFLTTESEFRKAAKAALLKQ